MSDFDLNSLKGKIGEEIAKYHFEKIGFKVIKTGKEELFSKDLANLAGNFKSSKFQNKSTQLVFEIYNKILSKLPDLLIYKNSENGLMIKFVEVKYRKTFKKDKTLIIDENNDDLQIKKYLDNLDNLYKLLGLDKDSVYQNWPDVFVYLLTNDNIYFGKVFKKDNKYELPLLTPSEVEKKYSKNWPGFKSVAEQLINEYILKN